ncbi:unnamed protein product [Sphagnum jensenii]
MTAPKPDPLAFGDIPDPDEDPDAAAEEPAAPVPASEPEAKAAPNRRLKNVWTANDGGPGPAEWRRHQGESPSSMSTERL